MTITVKVSEETKKEMEEFFEDYKREKTPPYAVFQADDADCVVTLYESGKAVFQGRDADLAADFWIETEKINSGEAKVTSSDEKKEKKDKKQRSDKEDEESKEEQDESGEEIGRAHV